MTEVINFPMSYPPIIGADVSRYNADLNDPDNIVHFDWDIYPGQFAILRATVATVGYDFEFEYNVQKCIEKGIPFGFYHYTKLWHSIPKQAEIFSEVINRFKDHPLFLGNQKGFENRGAFLDVEENDGLDKTVFTGNNQKLVIQIKNATGIIVGEYTRALFMNSNSYRNDWMKDMWLWDAHWFTGIDPYNIPLVRPYVADNWAAINHPIEPVLWQFDSPKLGREWGSTGDDNIDLNWFTYNGGTKEAFKSLFNVEPRIFTPPIPPTPEPTNYVTCTASALNIRHVPSILGNKVGLLYKGDRPDALAEVKDSAGNVWIRIGWKQYAAMNYQGNIYLEYS